MFLLVYGIPVACLDFDTMSPESHSFGELLASQRVCVWVHACVCACGFPSAISFFLLLLVQI